ncbi:MAG TPA: hypothetical protein VJN96_12190 [Vicinamibacterales bacterium]|nr:hypothetical protein [Vicinamibacterales bacterium]
MKNDRAKEPIQSLEDLSITVDTAFVQGRVIAQVNFRECAEGDVRLPPDAVTALEDTRAFARFDVLGLALVSGFSAGPIPPSIDSEVVVPVMPAVRRGWTVEGIGLPVFEALITTAAFVDTHRTGSPADPR